MDELVKNKKTSICFVVPKAYIYFSNKTDIPPGGAERQVYYLGRKIANDNCFDVNYCVADYGQNERFSSYGKIKVWKSFSFNENRFKAIFKLFKSLKQVKADIYIFRAADVGVFFATSIVKFLLRRKTLYMVANNEEAVSTKAMLKTMGWLTGFFMGFTYKFIDILTVQSQEQASAFLTNRKREANGIIRNILKISLEKSDIKFEQKSTILWVGRCHKIKQPEVFIELAARFPNEEFIMICPKASGAAKYFKDIKQKAGKVKNLQFIDFVEPDKIYQYYINAKIYAITSESEGFPNTMMEAMEAMCPVLSLNINPDNILHEHNIGLCSNELQLFYQNFEKLNADAELRTKMGFNGRKYLQEYHNEDVIIDDFKNLLIEA